MIEKNHSAQQLASLHDIVQPYIRADRVGTIVALILLPLFIGGFGVLAARFLPSPFGAWIGAGAWIVTLLLMLFVFAYRFRTLTGAPYALEGVLKNKRILATRYGSEAYFLEIEVERAPALSPSGDAGEIARWNGKTVRRVARTRAVFDTLGIGERGLFACVPGGPVVAVAGN